MFEEFGKRVGKFATQLLTNSASREDLTENSSFPKRDNHVHQMKLSGRNPPKRGQIYTTLSLKVLRSNVGLLDHVCPAVIFGSIEEAPTADNGVVSPRIESQWRPVALDGECIRYLWTSTRRIIPVLLIFGLCGLPTAGRTADLPAA